MTKNLSFKTYLTEGISNILYHQSDMTNIKNIISSDTIKLSSTMAKSIESSVSRKYFYFSTTRSRVGSYHFSHDMKDALPSKMVLLKLDGQRLSNVVSGGPVDYWGREFRKINPAKTEMEDRIISDKPEIKNASKYIISVECYYNAKNEWSNDDRINPLRDVIKLCLDRGIQVNLYRTQQDFITGKRALTNQDALNVVNDHGPELEKHDRNRESFLQPYIELMTATNTEGLSKKAQDILRALGYTYDFRNEVQRLQSDFHNDNKHDDSRKLTLLAKQVKVKTLADLLAYIRDKFKGQS